jgi:hypothetical protein
MVYSSLTNFVTQYPHTRSLVLSLSISFHLTSPVGWDDKKERLVAEEKRDSSDRGKREARTRSVFFLFFCR